MKLLILSAMPDRKGNSSLLISVQILRAVAALAVMIAHFHHEFIELAGGFGFGFGGLGVDLFFVISGFIMIHTCWSMFGQENAAINFFLRRLARIVPLYWLVSFTTLVFILITQPLSLADLSITSILGSFFFIPVPRPSGSFNPLLSVGWTLNYEMLFYTIFAIALFFRRIWGVIFAWSILIGLAYQIFPIDQSVVKFWSTPMVLEFGFGMLVGIAYRCKFRITKFSAILVMLLGAAVVIAFYMMIAYNLQFWLPSERSYSVGTGMSLIVIGAVLHRWELNGTVWEWLSSIGDASYGVYVLHPLMLWPHVILGMYGVSFPTKNIFYVALLVMLSITLALVTFDYLEKPITSGLSRKIHEKFSIGSNKLFSVEFVMAKILRSISVFDDFTKNIQPKVICFMCLIGLYVAYIVFCKWSALWCQ